MKLLFAGGRFDLRGPSQLLQQFERVPLSHRISELRSEVQQQSSWPATESLDDNGTGNTALSNVECILSSLGDRNSTERAHLDARAVEWEWTGASGWLRTRLAMARVRATHSGLCAEANIAPGVRSAESLLTGLAALLLDQAGGVILHAASVDLPAGVVAMIGPSGAGKSTACLQVDGAKSFSVDRLAVRPIPCGGWMAYPLPGGTDSSQRLPPCEFLQRPLRAIFRVRQTAGCARIEACKRPLALAMLRESSLHTSRSAEAENDLLERLQLLTQQVPFAILHSSLGSLLRPLLDRWLSTRSQVSSG